MTLVFARRRRGAACSFTIAQFTEKESKFAQIKVLFFLMMAITAVFPWGQGQGCGAGADGGGPAGGAGVDGERWKTVDFSTENDAFQQNP